MRNFLTKGVILIITLVSFSLTADAQKRKANKDTEQWKYEIECMGTGTAGTYLVKVFSYNKKPHIAEAQAKKNAIHGIIFKGFAGDRSKGCSTQKPLARNPSVEFDKEDFFKDFFADGGRYMKFVSSSSDGSTGGRDVTKVGKKLYKIGVVVSVHKDALRKDLEAAGVLKGLASGF